MRHTAESHTPSCGCRSVGECTHGLFADNDALDALVDELAAEMKKKLREAKTWKGKAGWDDPNWPIEDIKKRLIAHVEKGDPVDVANFAAFWFNKI